MQQTVFTNLIPANVFSQVIPQQTQLILLHWVVFEAGQVEILKSVKDGLLLKIKNLHIHLYFIAKQYL